MKSLSTTVLIWLFGTWGFSELSDGIATGANAVTPIVIFASYFTTFGLLLIGVLIGWSVFLGIFRLRANANFFGAKDKNEAFFYPLRMVMGMMLCAPVIQVASIASQSITLTPGHALIVGLAKTASAAGDAAQMYSFKLMHDYDLLHDPDLDIPVSNAAAVAQVSSWYVSAAQVAATVQYKDPTGQYREMPAAQLAEETLRARWASARPSNDSQVDPWLINVSRTANVPVIIPEGIAVQNTDSKTGHSGLIDGTAVERQLSGQDWVCQATQNSSFEFAGRWSCTDEYLSLKQRSSSAIDRGITKAQRIVWTGLVEAVRARAWQSYDGVTPQLNAEFDKQNQLFIQKMATWYAGEVHRLIREELTTERTASAAKYYEKLGEWGWMAGGTFVLRAANDFGRAQSYAEGATAQLVPTGSLAALTPGDDLALIVQNQAISNATQAEEDGFWANAKSTIINDVLHLDMLLAADPSKTNLGTVTSWGRGVSGTGMGFLAAGSVAKAGGMIADKLGKSPTPSGLMGKATELLFGKLGAALFLMGLVLLIVGAFTGYILPVVYAVFGFMGVISWLTFLVSSFFGINLWSAAQAAPKGEEHSSHMAAKGWNVLIFITLYPLLAVGGLAASVVITGIGLPLLNLFMSGIWGMFDSSASGGWGEAAAGMLVGGVLMVGIFGFMAWSLCMTAAQLITSFPRSVLNMVSFSEPGLSPYENVSSGVMGGITGAARGMVLTPANHAVRHTLGSLLNRSPKENGRAQGD
ncbi:hypothetical protein [Pseudomonas sp. MWU12-2037]|uniref:hypothetical protein n=1 Tax=Pseudomonas sp. MWU12-2037 TaxID=2928690 RepID=UPI002010422E|nr:hypothetical protein [Pseudomonas sp. MWU12-2037]